MYFVWIILSLLALPLFMYGATAYFLLEEILTIEAVAALLLVTWFLVYKTLLLFRRTRYLHYLLSLHAVLISVTVFGLIRVKVPSPPDIALYVSILAPIVALLFALAAKKVGETFGIAAIGLSAIAVLISNGVTGDSIVSVKRCLYMEGDLQHFQGMLQSRGIEIEMVEESCITYRADESTSNTMWTEFSSRSTADQPPAGRSESWGDQNDEIVDLLSREGINTSRTYYNGVEFITWEEDDSSQVEELLQFSEIKKKLFREARESER
jgi:xanthosine utilization system XapX-like protein